MTRLIRAVLLAALVLAGLLVSAPAASAATIDVFPGQSIQAAIRRANPGDTIRVRAGIFRESLLIRKDGIKLIGAGNNGNGTILEPPATANSFCGEGPNSFPGICVLAKQLDQNFNVITPVNNVWVEGFLVRKFPGDGIVSFGANRTTFTRNTAANNQSYGITSFVSTGNVFSFLEAFDNDAPGFYIGDSPNAAFSLTNSTSRGNEMGIFVREANNGEIARNTFEDNCVGIFLLNHGAPPDINVRVQNWLIRDNVLGHNNKFCPGGDGEPATTGIGILLGGTKNVTVDHNFVHGNQGPANNPFSGGITLLSTVPFGGNPPVDNRISNNGVFNNEPFDIRWDRRGSGNTFPTNSCQKSQPASICG